MTKSGKDRSMTARAVASAGITENCMSGTDMTRAEVAAFIGREFVRPQSNKVLHAHPSPMYWRPNDGKAAERWRNRARLAKRRRFKDNLYLGIPFCIPTDPAHCGFCLFPTQDYKGKSQIPDYLDYLEREADLYGDMLSSDTLASIYVGGGTPNLLRDGEYARLMAIARKLYGDVAPGIEKTLEGIPQLFTRDKVDAIRSAGFTRVSMGVQQLSDRLIRYSGRKQTRQQVMDALAHFNEARLACNVDLIYGWPEQSIDDMLFDLDELVRSGVRHITHYQLNIAGRSDFSKAQRARLPSFEETVEMYRESVRFLTARGFRQATVYDWERVDPDDEGHFQFAGAERYQYETHLRRMLDVEDGDFVMQHMVGIGYAAIGIPPASWDPADGLCWMQMNHRSLEAYHASIDAGQFPVDRQFVQALPDMKLVWLYQSMQAMTIDLGAYERVFGSDAFGEFEPIWEELAARDWIEIANDTIRFVDIGAFHIPMLQALLSQTRLGQLRDETERAAGTRRVVPIHAEI